MESIYIFSYQKNTQYTVPVYTGMIKEKLKSFQDFVIRIKYLQKLFDNLVIPFETKERNACSSQLGYTNQKLQVRFGNTCIYKKN